jgi:hypothetical protein
MNGNQRGRPSFPGGDAKAINRLRSPHNSRLQDGAQAHKVLPIVPSVMPPVTAAPVGVRVISVSTGTPVVPRSVIPRPYGNDYAGRLSRFRAHQQHREQC